MNSYLKSVTVQLITLICIILMKSEGRIVMTALASNNYCLQGATMLQQQLKGLATCWYCKMPLNRWIGESSPQVQWGAASHTAYCWPASGGAFGNGDLRLPSLYRWLKQSAVNAARKWQRYKGGKKPFWGAWQVHPSSIQGVRPRRIHKALRYMFTSI